MTKTFSLKDIMAMEQRFRATFINSLGGFKSVLLVGTRSGSGKENLAIFSSFFHLGANPPLFGLVIRPDVSPRHTLENILETKSFTLNQIREDFFEKAHHTAARYPREISEFDASGLTAHYRPDFFAPAVNESYIQIGASFKERIDIPLNGTSIIVGQIEWVHLPEEIIHEDGYVDLVQAGTITCSGLDAYHKAEPIKRLTYAKPIIKA